MKSQPADLDSRYAYHRDLAVAALRPGQFNVREWIKAQCLRQWRTDRHRCTGVDDERVPARFAKQCVQLNRILGEAKPGADGKVSLHG